MWMSLGGFHERAQEDGFMCVCWPLQFLCTSMLQTKQHVHCQCWITFYTVYRSLHTGSRMLTLS